jgi:hypothetical protein
MPACATATSADRPANEDNSVVAEGYFLIDAKASYRFANLELGATWRIC